MTRPTYFAGLSGSTYSYVPLDPDVGSSRRAGNFVFARVTPTGADIIYAGEAENFSSVEWRDLWERAEKEHGATTILVRLNVARVVREAEREDIIAEHKPPMNQR